MALSVRALAYQAAAGAPKKVYPAPPRLLQSIEVHLKHRPAAFLPFSGAFMASFPPVIEWAAGRAA